MFVIAYKLSMDYPTDEDLYELQYQDELDALNEMEPTDRKIYFY